MWGVIFIYLGVSSFYTHVLDGPSGPCLGMGGQLYSVPLPSFRLLPRPRERRGRTQTSGPRTPWWPPTFLRFLSGSTQDYGVLGRPKKWNPDVPERTYEDLLKVKEGSVVTEELDTFNSHVPSEESFRGVGDGLGRSSFRGTLFR